MKNCLIVLVSFIFSLSSFGDELHLSVGKSLYRLVTNPRDAKAEYIYLTESCWEQKDKCEAYKALSTMKWSQFTPKEKSNGGKNPASIFCREAFMAEVVIAKEKNSNEHSLCLFKDKSVIPTDSLVYSAKHL